MSWDTTSPLSSPAVRFASVETDMLALWQEFLSGFFDGNEHDVNGASIVFSNVEFSFQQGRITQPTGKAISVGWTRPKEVKSHMVTGTTRRFWMPVELTFYVRVAGSNSGDGGPHVMVKKVDDLLYAILSSRDIIRFLAQKGIHQVRPQTPVMVANPDYPVRQIQVSSMVQYIETGFAGFDDSIYPDGTLITHSNAALVTDDGSFLVY